MKIRPQPSLDFRTAPLAFALRGITDAKERRRKRVQAVTLAMAQAPQTWERNGWLYSLDVRPRVMLSPKDQLREAAVYDLTVNDGTQTIFHDRIQAWDGTPVLVPDGTQHEETIDGETVLRDNFREDPVEAARSDLEHTVKVVTKNGPWVKDKPGTVSTFYGTEDDGNIDSNQLGGSGAANYAAAAAGSGTITAGATPLWVGQVGFGGANQYRGVYESFTAFDLSGLPDDDNITDAVLSLYGVSDLYTVDVSLEARSYDWGVSLTTADWRTPAQLSGLTRLATFDTTGFSASGYNDFTADGSNLLNAIDPTATLRMILCSAETVAASDPGVADEYGAFRAADEAGTTQDPKLVVTHAPASKAFRKTLLGVGF